MQFHIQGFWLYLSRLEEDQQTREGLEKLKQIDTLIEYLRQSFKSHPDKRMNALRETDVIREKKAP